ncbi:MAG: Fe-S cluster assembly protein SufD, partial [Bacteroidetes bacterium]|nr:Fe-S cluster assembly protein SufD [Fibrella sp.]
MTPTNQQYTSFKDRLVTAFRDNEARMNGESKTSLHQLRQTALQTFDRLGFPTIKHEEWKYSNLSAMLREAFDFSAGSTLTVSELDQLRIPNLAGNVLYFVNGHYRPDLSRIVSPESEVQIKPLAEMIQTDSETIGTHFARYADFQDNAFTALNTAFAGDG